MGDMCMSQTTQPQTIIPVPRPTAGTAQAIDSQAGALIQLTFPEGDATFDRAGNDLTLSFADGGRVTLTNFFAVGDQSLPTLKLADATEVASKDFLAANYPEMNTAAGPAPTAAPPSSGEGEYDDNSGVLINGVDRFGSLGTDYWGYTSEAPDYIRGLDLAGGTFSFGVITGPTGSLGAIAGVYEDGLPHQYKGDFHSLEAGRLSLDVQPGPGSSVSAVTISGLPAGAVLWLGSPADGTGTPLDPNAAGEYTFSLAQFTGPGVFILPPQNDSDADFPINVSVTFDNGVDSVTESIVAVVVVDAVADMPGRGRADLHIDRQDHAEWGTHRSHGGTRVRTGEADEITFDVRVAFRDYADGSEFHTIEVKGIPADWTLNPLGLGSLASVGSFASLDEARAALHNAPDSYAQANINGEVTYIFNVSGLARVDSTLSFDPHDWTSRRDADGNPHADGPISPTIEITARAEEINFSGEELTLDNNIAEKPLGDWRVTIREDTPDFYGRRVSILSDESKGVQPWTDEISLWRFAHDASLQAVLAGLRGEGIDIPTGNPVSVAREGIFYNLHSDGVDDAGGNAGKAFLGFEGSDGADSGWKTTAGENIYLYYQDGVVIGRVGGANGADPDGRVAFVVAAEDDDGVLSGGVNHGSVTFIQYASLHHPQPGGPGRQHNEKMAESLDLKLVLTDDDGDKAAIEVSINVRDDGPKCLVIGKAHKLDETFMRDVDHDGAFDHLNTTGGTVHVDFGADGPAKDAPFRFDVSDLKAMGLQSGGLPLSIDDADPTKITASLPDGTPVFTLTIDAAGNYTYTQFQPLDHPVQGSSHYAHDDPLKLPFTVVATDGDGDTIRAEGRIIVDDDGPSAGLLPATGWVWEGMFRFTDELHASGKIHVDFGADDTGGLKAVFWDAKAVAAELQSENLHATVGPEGTKIPLSVLNAGDTDPKMLNIGWKDAAGNEHVVMKLELIDDGHGTYRYQYTQYDTIAHGSSGIADILEALSFSYVVRDADGDTASNKVVVHIKDSHVLPTIDGAHVDESHDMHTTHTFDFNNLDYNAPDGIASVTWNEALVEKALGRYHATNSKAHLAVTVSADGSLLTVTDGPGGDLVFTAKLIGNATTGYQVEYTQSHALSHLIPGLAHDDPLPLLLPVDVTDGDGDVVQSLFGITVDDDGPAGLFASNVLMLEYIGQTILEGLGSLDLSNPQTFIQSLTEMLGQSLQAGLKPEALTDLVDLLVNTNLSNNGSGLGGFPLGIFGKDSDRTEGGAPYIGKLNPDFGVDGPASADSQITGWDLLHGGKTPAGVGWSPLGVQAMLTLLGVHASGHPNTMLTVDAVGTTYPPTVLEVMAGNERVMTLEIVESNGAYSYKITQHMGLEHDPNLVQDLLADVLGKALQGVIPAELQGLLDTLGLGLNDLTKALGSGNLLTLPLPLVIMDGDGDVAPGMVTLTIRDSEPSLGQIAGLTVAEADLPTGTDYIPGTPHSHDTDNRGDGRPTEHEELASGSFTFNLGFDVAGSSAVITGPNGAVNLLNLAAGATIEGHYGKLTVTEVSGPATDGAYTVKYTYELTNRAQHADDAGANRTLAPGEPAEAFTVSVTDGDGDSRSSTLNVTIVDDIPEVHSEWDVTDTGGKAGLDNHDWWGAEGNILTGQGVTGADGSSPVAKDLWGADGPADYAYQGGNLTGGPLRVEGKYVAANGETAVDGTFGTLFIKADGSYRYEVDAARLNAAQPELKPGAFGAAVSLANVEPASVSGMNFSAYQGNINLLAADNTSLAALLQGIGADTPAKTAAGMGVAGSVTSGWFGLNDVDEIGGTLSSREGLLITLDELAADAKLSFAGVSGAEQLVVYAFDAAGNCLSKTLVLGQSGWEFEGTTLTGIKSLLVVAGAYSSFTVSSVTTAPYIKEFTEVFDYSLIDADGDAVAGALTINVKGTPPTIDFVPGDNIVYEAHMPGGSLENDTTHGHGFTTTLTYTVALNYGPNPVFTIGGKEYVADGSGNLHDKSGSGFTEVDASYGKITGGTFDGTTLKLTYALTDNYTHPDDTPQAAVDKQIAEDVDAVAVTVTTDIASSKPATGHVDIADDVPLAGGANATLFESDIVGLTVGGKQVTNSGTDSTHKYLNDTDNDEFRLVPDDLEPTAGTHNQAHAEGVVALNYGADKAATDGNAFVWNIPQGMGGLKAMVEGSWQAVTWDNTGKTTLLGKVGDVTVLQLTMNPATGGYTADLYAGLKHDDPDAPNSFDRNLDLDGFTPDAPTTLGFTYTVKDGDGDTATGSLNIQVQDDILDVPDSTGTVKWTSGTGPAPDIFFDYDHTIDLTVNGTDLSTTGLNFRFQKAVIAGDSIDLDTHPAADGTIYRGPDGLGVHGSSIDPGGPHEHDRFLEINYDKATNTSEAVVVDLGGKLAFGLNLGMGKFYANNDEAMEKGRMTFYRDGKEVGHYDFQSSNASGTADIFFDAIPGGFDKVVITALDNGGAPGADNSDFFIKSLKFDTIEEEVIHYERGSAGNPADIAGADGVKPDSLRFTASQGDISTNLGDIGLTVGGNGTHIVGMLNGEKVFEAFLTPSTGVWDYFQFKPFTVTDGDNDGKPDPIAFSFQVQDNDGDFAYANIVVDNPGLPPGITLDVRASDLTVYEGHLDNGTFANAVSGHAGHDVEATLLYNVDLKGGVLQSFTVGGALFTWNGTTLTGDLGDIAVNNGKVTGVSYNKATGVLSVTYELTDPATHTAPGGEEVLDVSALPVDIAVSVTTNAATTSANGSIIIVDDAPIVEFDGVYTGGVLEHVDGDDAHTASIGTPVQGIIGLEAGADGLKSLTVNGVDVTHATAAAKMTVSDANDHGEMQVWQDAAGVWRYSYTPTSATGGSPDAFEVVATDKDGDTASDTLTVTVKPSAPSVSITLTDGEIHEAALPEGTGKTWDSNGNPTGDTTDITATGVITVTGPYDAVTVGIGGVEVAIPTLGVGATSAALNVGHGTVTFTNNGNGSYGFTYTLTSAMTHTQGQGPDGLKPNYTVNEKAELDVTAKASVTTGGTTMTGTATPGSITVIDDELSAKGTSIVIEEPGPQDYCITIMLDTSGSMAGSRLRLAKQALENLLQTYETQSNGGELSIRLITFESYDTLQGENMTVAQAIAKINALSASGGTDYYEPLATAGTKILADLANPAYAGYTHKAYFISDGEPNEPHSGRHVPLAWENLVNGPNADKVDVHSVGIDVNATAETELRKIVNPDDNADTFTNVKSAADLSKALEDTVATVDGNLLATSVLGADGVDAIIAYKGAPIAWGPDGSIEIKLDGDDVVLKIWNGTDGKHALGDYELKVTGNIAEDTIYQDVSLTLRDGDGDTRTITLPIEVKAYDAVHAQDDAGTAVLSAHPSTADDAAEANLAASGFEAAAGTVTSVASISGPANYTDIHGTKSSFSGGHNSGGWLKIEATGNLDAAEAETPGLRALIRQNLATDGKRIGTIGMVEKAFALLGKGSVAFNFEALNGYRNKSNIDHDGALWVLKDAKGNVVRSGTIWQNTSNSKWADGLLQIDGIDAGAYQLLIVVANVSGTGGANEANAQLYLDKFYISGDPGYECSGNVLTNDTLETRGTLSLTRVEIDGHEHAFGSADHLNLDTGHGLLTIRADGSYSYVGTETDLNVTYTATSTYGDNDSAELYIRGGATITGTAGNDVLHGTPLGEVIHGGDGNDILFGYDGNDVLYGGAGNDILYGGKGDDILYGGLGDDIFAWRAGDYDGGIDKVMDFELGHDKLRFDDLFSTGDALSAQLAMALKSGDIDVDTNIAGDLLTLTLYGSREQTVEVHLGSALDTTQIAEIMHDDSAAKAALLEQIIVQYGS